MFTTNDLYLNAILDERSRERTALMSSRQAERLVHATPARIAPLHRQSAAQRTLQMLSELYGPGQPYGTDPALFNRLAWVGFDD